LEQPVFFEDLEEAAKQLAVARFNAQPSRE